MTNLHVVFTPRARRLLSWAALCLSIGQSAFGQTRAPAPTLALDEAIRTAIENSRPVKIAQLEVAKAESNLTALKTRRLPNFDVKFLDGALVAPMNLSFPAGAFGTFPTTGPIPFADTTITTNPRLSSFLFARVAQPLTQLRTIGWGQRALTVEEEIAREQVRSQEQTVRNNVKKLYYGLLQAQAGVAANVEALNLYHELDRVVGDYVERQVVLAAEGLTVKTSLARQEQTALMLRNTIATLKEQMNLLLGRDLAEDFAVQPMSADLGAADDVTGLERRALDQRPEVRQARLRVQQAEFDLERTKSAAIPEISVGFNYFGFYNVEVLPTNVAAFGVIGSWEPFDWGRKKAERAVKASTVEQARIAVKEAEDAVRVDVRSQYRKVQETRAALTVADLDRQTTHEQLRVATNQFRQQANLHRQVLEAQAKSANSEQQFSAALAAYWTARADFDKAMGEDR